MRFGWRRLFGRERPSVAPGLAVLALLCVLCVPQLAACTSEAGIRGGADDGGPLERSGTSTAAVAPGDRAGNPLIEVTLLEVVDGDTIWVLMPDRREEKVRYIGLDAPEVAHPDAPGEYLGSEASAHNVQLLQSGPLRMQTDVEERDQYGRLLAYVWAGDVFVNERLVLDGYAEARSYPPNLTFQSQLEEAQRKARNARVGIWASTTTS